ncbi:MAG TPA: hypothetical protein VJ761_12715 [Ktedonobacteraceae bacterium]|nr:hypothetical protein [Ktedonobacteraceae bacterium]
MKTKDNDTIGTQPALRQPNERPKGKGWLAGLGAVIVVALVVGLSVFVFAQARPHGGTQAAPIPPGGQWQLVLKGYTITALVAASSDPANLYACATQAPNGSGQQGSGPLALLHSIDFGAHWQDMGKTAALSGSCQVAVNAANGNEVYVVTATANGQTSEVLKHSTDGGQTWETISPVLSTPGGKSTMPWDVQELRLVGNRLIALQWTQLDSRPYINQPPYGILSRVITSTDGGHNWTVFDSGLTSTNLGTFDYAVDPSNPDTVYELLGLPWLPPVAKTAGASDMLPSAIGSNEKLYKTSDNGTTWHMLLDNLPFRAQIQLASSNPNIVYAGGINGPLPLAGQPGVQPKQPAYPDVVGGFQLRMSSDGGTTWRDIAPPAGLFGLSNWFVTADGQVILGGLYVATGSPTAIPGTVVPVTPVVSPPQASYGIQNGNDTAVDVHAPMSSQAPMAALSLYIQRYDPVANKWSRVVMPPAYGLVIQVTAAETNRGAVLWFMGTNNKEVDLYRYVI